jgi:hypothetical protein
MYVRRMLSQSLGIKVGMYLKCIGVLSAKYYRSFHLLQYYNNYCYCLPVVVHRV